MISTHILDTTLGHPAAQVTVQLEKKGGSSWHIVGTEKTNADGRISYSCEPEEGQYRLQFFVDDYFRKNSTESFFTTVTVHFLISDTSRKYHVPLLLNPFGYSTYRGS